ncbi:methyltransferase [Streptomyces sp. NPDC053079]|uniref:methyltransferase n=1 Tax=Streptomyces sp. NPDC053079 TaxID=3365697 RepID=UPI0037D1CD77
MTDTRRQANAERGPAALATLATPMSVRVAATLRLADHLAPGPRTAAQLAAATGTHAPTLDRLLRHLCTLGLLHHDTPGHYRLTADGEPLREDHPGALRARLALDGPEGLADLSFIHLLHTVRTGEPAFPRQYGHTFWEHLAEDDALTAAFHHRMGRAVDTLAPAVAAAYDWAPLEHVVDVGGGNGSLLTALLLRCPRLRGTVLDLPDAAPAAERAFADAGVAPRAAFVAGSFFDPLPPGAPAYVLSAVLHNWGDDDARAILRRCAEAAGHEGRVLVIEKSAPAGGAPGTEEDLRMLAYFGARERGSDEIRRLAATAGLTATGVHPAGPVAVVELRGART